MSRRDAEELEDSYRLTDVAEVSTGVDVDYSSSSGKTEIDPFEIVFTGSMDWLPNQDAVNFFLDAVLPSLVSSTPEAHFPVVGRDLPPGLVARTKTDPHLTVTGFVDDVRPFVEWAAVFMVPIRIGSGTRLTIFEVMSMGTPMVSTTVGAEGLPLKAGEDILIADEQSGHIDILTTSIPDSRQLDVAQA